jgi:hypothetical protein
MEKIDQSKHESSPARVSASDTISKNEYESNLPRVRTNDTIKYCLIFFIFFQMISGPHQPEESQNLLWESTTDLELKVIIFYFCSYFLFGFIYIYINMLWFY